MSSEQCLGMECAMMYEYTCMCLHYDTVYCYSIILLCMWSDNKWTSTILHIRGLITHLFFFCAETWFGIVIEGTWGAYSNQGIMYS